VYGFVQFPCEVYNRCIHEIPGTGVCLLSYNNVYMHVKERWYSTDITINAVLDPSLQLYYDIKM